MEAEGEGDGGARGGDNNNNGEMHNNYINIIHIICLFFFQLMPCRRSHMMTQ